MLKNGVLYPKSIAISSEIVRKLSPFRKGGGSDNPIIMKSNKKKQLQITLMTKTKKLILSEENSPFRIKITILKKRKKVLNRLL